MMAAIEDGRDKSMEWKEGDVMSDGTLKLTNPDQLDVMSQAHRSQGDTVHATADQLDSGHNMLRGCQGWGGPGYDEFSQFFAQFISQLRDFGNVKYRQADAVVASKVNHLNTEASNAQKMAPPKR
jgi:uncharacterized protein YukE